MADGAAITATRDDISDDSGAPASLLWLTPLLAVVYVIGGYVGQFLAIPPGNVSILWPPSGIAMAAVLLVGWRALPGLFIGAVVINGQAFYSSAGGDVHLTAVVAALTIGVGSILQPYVGRVLVHRFGNGADPFGQAGATVRTLALMPIVCLVSAGIGSTTLNLTGIAPQSQWTVFTTWWMGDLIGVLVFAPLVYAILRQSRAMATVLIATTFVLFAGTYVASNQVRDQAVSVWDGHASREAERLTTTIVSWLETTIAPVNSIGALFESSDGVYEDEFIEAAIRLEDFQPDFFPNTLSVAANVPRPDGSIDWMVLYSTDDTGDFETGRIIGAEELGYAAIQAALDEPGRLVIGEFLEIGDTNLAIAAIGIERADFEQVVLGVVDFRSLLDGLFEVQVPNGFHLNVDAAASGESPEDVKSIYRHPHNHEETMITQKSVRGTVGAAVFVLDWHVTDAFLPGSRDELGNAVLAGGLFGSAGLILFLVFILGQNEQIRERVRVRTAELAESQATLNVAMDNMPGGMMLTDKDLKVQLVNTEFASLAGIPDDLIKPGDPHEKLIRFMAERGTYGADVDVEEAVQERLRSLINPGKEVYFDHLPDGRVNAVRRRKTPDGDVVTIITDVTEQVRTQEIATRLREAMDIFNDSIILYDKDERVIFTNNRYHQFYPSSPAKDEIAGRTQEQLIRHSLEKGLIEDPLADSDPEQWLANRLADRRANPEMEAETNLTDGKILLTRQQPTSDGGVIISHTDITERKRMERAIRESEQQLLHMLEASPIAVAISVDDQTDDDGKIVFTNNRFRTMLGFEAEKLSDARTSDFMPISENREDQERALDEGQSLVDLEVEVLTTAGERVWTIMTVNPIVHDGRKSALIWLYDISERKLAEQEIAEKEALLRMAMDNMPGAMIVVDDDLQVALVNDTYKEYYGDPDGKVATGVPMVDLLRSEALRGLLGPGDPAKIVEDRLGGYVNGISLDVVDRSDDGRYIQLMRRPVEGGYTVSVAIDVTEQKLAEAELAEKEAEIRLALQNMPGGICMLDGDLRVQVVNDRYCELYGRPQSDYEPGTPIRRLIDENVKLEMRLDGTFTEEAAQARVRRRLSDFRSGVPGESERELPNGRVLHVRHNPIEGGGVVLVVTDITARRRAQEEIQDQQQRMSDILNNAQQGMVLWDADRHPIAWNNKFPDALNLEEEVLKESGFNILKLAEILAERGHYGEGDTKDLAAGRVETLWSGNSQSEVSFDGKRTFDVRSTLTDAGRLVVSYTDITDRKASELKIQLQEQQLRAIIENIPLVIILKDKFGKHLTTNSYYEVATGIASEDVIGKTDDEFLPPDVAASIIEMDQDIMRSGEPRTFEEEMPNPDGTVHSFLTTKAPVLTADGEADTLVVAALDITERKRAEQLIEMERTRLADAIEALDAAFAMFDADEKLVVFNGKYEALFEAGDVDLRPGLTLEELARLACEAGKYHELRGETVEKWVSRRVAAQRAHRVGILSEVNDRWYILSHFPTSDGGVVSVRYDVTDLKQTERELANKEAILSAALENMTGGLFMIDGSLELRVFNDRLAELYDLPDDMLKVGMSVRDILQVRAERGDYGEGDVTELVKKRMEGYRNRDVQIIIDQVGERTVEVYRAPMADGGMVCVFNDITERKRAEDELNRAHSLITESLSYASRIQRSLLPPRTILEEVFADHAMVWEPKDMVGGDMVWLRPAEGGVYLIVADCTGHGPPGAFMTMICTGALDQTLAELEEPDPAEVLAGMNAKIKVALGQDGDQGESDDGVELGVCHIDKRHKQLTFAGARFSICIVDGEKMDEVKGNKSAIGYRHVPMDVQFDNHTIKIKQGMRCYLWTDGMVDQIGGPKNRSFGKRRLRKAIMDYHQMDMGWQRSQILREFEDYQHAEQRRDDITLFGFVPR